VVGHRKPTVDCDAEISYCRQWVDAGAVVLKGYEGCSGYSHG